MTLWGFGMLGVTPLRRWLSWDPIASLAKILGRGYVRLREEQGELSPLGQEGALVAEVQ